MAPGAALRGRRGRSAAPDGARDDADDADRVGARTPSWASTLGGRARARSASRVRSRRCACIVASWVLLTKPSAAATCAEIVGRSWGDRGEVVG